MKSDRGFLLHSEKPSAAAHRRLAGTVPGLSWALRGSSKSKPPRHVPTACRVPTAGAPIAAAHRLPGSVLPQCRAMRV